jgi:hypothetical protein
MAGGKMMDWLVRAALASQTTAPVHAVDLFAGAGSIRKGAFLPGITAVGTRIAALAPVAFARAA